MSTLSAWSTVVRLWRSFIASLSSASLRSSIRRSVASSRLQIEEWTGARNGQRTLRKRLKNSNRHTLRQAWMICAVVPLCRDLRAESSTPLWLDRKMRDGKRWGFSAHVWYICMQIAVCEIVSVFHLWHYWVSLTGSFLSVSVRQLWQSLLQSVAVLLSTPQLRLLLVTPQLQMSALARGNRWLKRGHKGKKVFRQLNPLTATYLDPFTPQHVLQPGHMLIHLFQLLLQDRVLVWQALIFIIHLIFHPPSVGLLALCTPPCQPTRRRCERAHPEGWDPSAEGSLKLARGTGRKGVKDRDLVASGLKCIAPVSLFKMTGDSVTWALQASSRFPLTRPGSHLGAIFTP